MSPEVIICDEISAEDVEQVIEAQNTGVPLIASAHCKTPNDLIKRGKMKKLIEFGVFPLCAVLGYDGSYKCQIGRTEGYL
jgi:stage III sporulation protein SpoIIIAA